MNDSLQQIICCLGHPVTGNPTQYVMDRALLAVGLDLRCLTLDVAPDDLRAAIDGARVMGFHGAVIAPPHESAVCELLPAADAVTSRLQQADLLLRNDAGELVAESTVGKAFAAALRSRLDPAQKRFVLLDDSVTALAVAAQVLEEGAEHVILVGDRDIGSAPAWQQPEFSSLEVVSSADFEREDPRADVVIRPDWDASSKTRAELAGAGFGLSPDSVVADFAFLANKSDVLDAAREAGCRTIEGLEVLCHKLAIAFRRWTAAEPDLELMNEALEEFFVI